eukprot:scaffold66382_cov36-Phaeocystis_antarctica.AAC.1
MSAWLHLTAEHSLHAADPNIEAHLHLPQVELQAELQARAGELQAARAECEGLRDELRAAAEAAATSTAHEVERATEALLTENGEA